jgi:hypothetical protein
VTKKEARARKAAWQQALSEGRVVRYNEGLTLVSYPTMAARDKALSEAKAAGVPAAIVWTQRKGETVVNGEGN